MVSESHINVSLRRDAKASEKAVGDGEKERVRSNSARCRGVVEEEIERVEDMKIESLQVRR